MTVAALILAAGTASRYRAADPSVTTKLVVRQDGVPLVRRVAEAALLSGARPVLVVTGHAEAEVRAALGGCAVAFARNPDYPTGLASSLRAGLGALPAGAAGALVLLGDMPGVTAPLLDRLIAAFAADPEAEAVVPVHGGRRGNPALLGRALFAPAALLTGDEGARRLLARGRVVEVAVDDAGVLLDVDEPAALAPGCGAAKVSADDRPRCAWPGNDPLYRAYHDTEWGVPERDGRALWEKLTLDGFQAGLSWITILRKRDAFRRAFRGFDPEAVARFGDAEVAALLGDAGIVRSRAKIVATVGNARAYLALRDRGEDFTAFCWDAVGGAVRQNAWRAGEVPTETAESRALSKALKARGFKFVGPVIVYAWMEAVGLVNDHLVTCFRHPELGGPPTP